MNELKPLIESKTFWGAVLALLSSGLSGAHYTLSAADAANAVDLVISVVSGIGGLLTIYGRVRASKAIGSFKAVPPAALLFALSFAAANLIAGIGPAMAQQSPRPRPQLTGDPIKDIQAANDRLRTKVTTDLTSVAKQIETLLDTADAINLATAVPGLQDTVGAACWKSFDQLSQLFKLHPLPLTLKVATDIEAARLAAMALNQVCTNPNCGQMWTDAENTAAALAIVPMPFSITSLCSKIPAIGTLNAAATMPVQPATGALGGTPATPAAPEK